MRLSKGTSILVLLATVVPLVYLACFIGGVVFLVFEGPKFGTLDRWFPYMFAAHLVCILWLWGLVAFYLVFLFKAPGIPQDYKVLWAVVLLFVNMLAMPVFWYLYMRPSVSGPGPKAAVLA